MSLLSLVPALVTIVVALVWHRVALALFCGVVTGALVLAGFQPLPALGALAHRLFEAFTDVERLKIVAFILLIGGLLELISASGAYLAFGRWVGNALRTGRRARMAAWGLSACLFFDDYANVLIAGSAMRPVTDRNRVPPALLAYLVDVMAMLASVMLVSTWAAFEGSLMVDAGRELGLKGTLSDFFLAALPYHFYAYLAIFLSLLVAWTGRWFGASLDRETFAGAPEEDLPEGAKPSHVLAPLLTLVAAAVGGLFLFGIRALRAQGEPITLIRILGAAPSVNILIGATCLAILVAGALLIKDRVLAHGPMRAHFHRGIQSMVEIGLIVLLATALSQMSKDLGTGLFIAHAFDRFLTPATLPFLVFVMSLLVTITTGFSWGAMAILMPVGFQMAAAQGGALLPVVSAAVITGAVAGEHVVPYSEKAVMSAAACGIPPLYHVRTQAFQTLAAVTAAGGAFLLAGYRQPLAVALGIPALGLLILHLFLARPAER